MTKILLIEDDEILAEGIIFALKKEGFSISACSKANDASEAFKGASFDLIILDVMLPDGTGFELCKKFRSVSDVPIIFLSACDQETNIVQGLDMGADDYITKPFGLRELISRINAVLRRKEQRASYCTINSGDVKINFMESKAYKDGSELLLTPTEYKILLYLSELPPPKRWMASWSILLL